MLANVGDPYRLERSESDMEREKTDGRSVVTDFGNERLRKMERCRRCGERTFFFTEFGLVIEGFFVGVLDVRREWKFSVGMKKIMDVSARNDSQYAAVRHFGFYFEHEVPKFDFRSHRKSRTGEDESLEARIFSRPNFP